MSEVLCSVGLDVGTTSTQMVVSRIRVENRASGFSVPEMQIMERELVYQSPVYFTPLLEENRMDAVALRRIVEQEYRTAGITRETVDTGAVIVTGETSRKENASAVLAALSDLAGEFVVAAAGPDLESVLAAKGAGAVDYSLQTGKTVLHVDIGGGTSNLALIRNGKVAATGCMNVGGRLIKLKSSDDAGDAAELTYVSPVLKGIWQGHVGQKITRQQAQTLAELLTRALEMAAGTIPGGALLRELTTREAEAALPLNDPGEQVLLSFSGGVADCIQEEKPWLEYGDLGPLLGQTIRKSSLCAREYTLGEQTIRATVIGAGCHSTQLSGSTVFCQNVPLPLKNIPVVTTEAEKRRQEGAVFLSLPGIRAPSYRQVEELAERIAASGLNPVYVCLEQDMAKALGQVLALRLGSGVPILCLDRIRAAEGSYLDVGCPVGPAFPVVKKTLIMQKFDSGETG